MYSTVQKPPFNVLLQQGCKDNPYLFLRVSVSTRKYRTFPLVIFWYIIPGFLQHFPEFSFRLRLSFISFSGRVIPYYLYHNIGSMGSPYCQSPANASEIIFGEKNS